MIQTIVHMLKMKYYLYVSIWKHGFEIDLSIITIRNKSHFKLKYTSFMYKPYNSTVMSPIHIFQNLIPEGLPLTCQTNNSQFGQIFFYDEFFSITWANGQVGHTNVSINQLYYTKTVSINNLLVCVLYYLFYFINLVTFLCDFYRLFLL